MSNNQRSCCYKTPAYPRSYQESCQFTYEEETRNQFVELAGLTFCRYHLPYSNETLKRDYDGNENANHGQLKQNWPRDKIEAFNKDILDRLSTARKTGQQCDLTGTVFPDQISFHGKKYPRSILDIASLQVEAPFLRQRNSLETRASATYSSPVDTQILHERNFPPETFFSMASSSMDPLVSAVLSS
ncbi:MAG TPA: hypothetical protein DD437_14190 [Rhodobiaceae bacterium]|nr:hypothetical protein [Rhodobiaceae bacterium]|tara:strand:- start:1291 stop:1851 length:561 start_codon:yes stop_codon:yes gene_type:complete